MATTVRDAEAGPSKRRDALLQRSLQRGGFGGDDDGDDARRTAWLTVLDLEHLQERLPSVRACNGTHEGADNGHISVAQPPLPPSPPLDSEGWQIATHDLEQSLCEDDEKRRDDSGSDGEWNVALSKRSRRRRRALTLENGGSGGGDHSGEMKPSSSGTTTASTVLSRDTSSIGFDLVTTATTDDDDDDDGEDTNGDSRDTLKAKRKARKRLKRQTRRAQSNSTADGHDDGDMTSSIVHVASSGAAHKDEEQVALDVRRSFIALGNTPLRAVRRSELSVVVNGVLRRHPALHYYQGYHDVISVLLSVMIPRKHANNDTDLDHVALAAVVDVASRVSMHFLRDSMTTDMTPTLGHLKVLRNIVRRRAPACARRCEQAAPLPYFALPWLLSLMAHDVGLDVACAIFDYVLPRGPLSMLFVCAALIETKVSSGVDDDGDAAEMHHALSQLPLTITIDNLPDILRVAEEIARGDSVEGGVMGHDSVLHTWSALPFNDISSAWTQADARADSILRGHTTNIVVNALPSPPQSDAGDDDGAAAAGHADRVVEKDAALVLRRWWRRPSTKQQPDAGALLAWLGAVGALSAALVILYGHGTTVASTNGLGSAFPVGLRAAEPLRAMLRYALPN